MKEHRPNEPEQRGIEELLAATQERIGRDATIRGWLRTRATRDRFLLCAALAALIAAATALLTLRSDFAAYPAVRMAVILASFGAAALGLAAVMLRRIHRPATARRDLVLLGFGLLFPVAVSLLPEAHDALHLHPESFAGHGDRFWPRAIGCLIFGSILSLPLVALLWFMDRGDQWSANGFLPAVAAGGLLGNLVLQLHCPLVAESHLIAGHATVPAALLLVVLVAVVLRRKTSRAR